MITLDERLRAAADDMLLTAKRVPVRPVVSPRISIGRALGWAAAAAATATLIAIPLWLGAFGDNGSRVIGGGQGTDDISAYLMGGADVIGFVGSTPPTDALALIDTVQGWDGVIGVAYVSPHDAHDEFIAMFSHREFPGYPDFAQIVRDVEADPSLIDGSIRLILADGADRRAIGERLRDLEGVHRVVIGTYEYPDAYVARPDDSGSIMTVSNVDRWAGGISVIAFLSDSLTPDEVETLVSNVGAWDEVETLIYLSKEEALAEFRAAFEGQDDIIVTAENSPWTFPSSIRLVLSPGVRVREIAERVAGMPGVRRVTARDTASEGPYAEPYSVGSDPGWRPPPDASLVDIIGGEPVEDTELLAYVGEQRVIPRTARLVATHDGGDLGVIYLFVYEVDPEPDPEIPEGPWYCLSTVWAAGGQVVGDLTQCGNTSQFTLPVVGVLIACPSGEAERRIATIAGLDPYGSNEALSTATLRFNDGATSAVDVVNGTIVHGWEGSGRYPTKVDLENSAILDPLQSAGFANSGC